MRITKIIKYFRSQKETEAAASRRLDLKQSWQVWVPDITRKKGDRKKASVFALSVYAVGI